MLQITLRLSTKHCQNTPCFNMKIIVAFCVLLLVLAVTTQESYAEGEPSGVVGGLQTPVRDPVFYRWHRFIDNIFQQYKANVQPYREHTAEWLRRLRRWPSDPNLADSVLAQSGGI
ncbi:hemocyanin subunit D-like [Anabrus simplex]|uniref:hemocyanin subunit D-like n=1 Tax=Anabrus simplex TaxID=316456 RepID=UPI0035A276E0